MEEQFIDLYSINNAADVDQSKVDSLFKAMAATQSTGRDLTDAVTSGSALKLESLDPTVKVLTNTDEHIKFWKMIPKEKTYDTVAQFNQLKDYGVDATSIFNGEAETPQFTDSQYIRRARKVKFTGIAGEVTDPMMLVRTQGGDMLAKEVTNKTQFLLRAMNEIIVSGNSSTVSTQFDGYLKQHFDGITEGSTTPLDDYANSDNVIDARGNALKDEYVINAAYAVTAKGFGFVNRIVANPKVFTDYSKRYLGDKRVMVSNPVSATTDATMGQRVSNIATQHGTVQVVDDIYFEKNRLVGKKYNATTTGSKSPATPTAGSTPIAVNTDSSTKFTDGASTYWYLVTAKNRYGESAPLVINTSGQAVTATQSVDLSFSISNNAYAAESFVIYRTEAGAAAYTTANYYPILEVTQTELTSGYDGGAAGIVRDRNRSIPNTSSAIVLTIDTNVLSYYQLAPFRRMDLAFTSPSYRFMILSYGTPALYAPLKVSRIMNIGSTIA